VRAAYVNVLSRIAACVHGEVSDGAETLSVSYKTVKTIENPVEKPAALVPRLLEHQKSHLRAELETGLCLSGPHKDDLEILISGVPARAFASQGQARTAALSLKLAERDIHFEDRGEYPVLLLDDVLSELDGRRQNFVLNHIDKGQVFITCCNVGDISSALGGRILRIEAGRLAGS
jgi:DNA replication and repair protein RecF